MDEYYVNRGDGKYGVLNKCLHLRHSTPIMSIPTSSEYKSIEGNSPELISNIPEARADALQMIVEYVTCKIRHLPCTFIRSIYGAPQGIK